MSGVNKVIILGNLGQDPEVRYLNNGDAVCNISVATSETWKDKETGEKKEHTEWHRVVFFRKLAEIAGQYLKKGSKVFIEGKLKTRKWEDKEGVTRYTTEIEAYEMQMLGSKPQDSTQKPQGSSEDYAKASGRSAAARKPAKAGADDKAFEDDDIPF